MKSLQHDMHIGIFTTWLHRGAIHFTFFNIIEYNNVEYLLQQSLFLVSSATSVLCFIFCLAVQTRT
jgi:hypothetical protein